jgi:hexosaminidase
MLSTGRPRRKLLVLLLASLLLLAAKQGNGETVSALYGRGYAVLPTPRKVNLSGKDFTIANDWRLEFGRGVKPDDEAIESLKEDLAMRHHLHIAEGGEAGKSPGVIRLAVTPGSVSIGEAADRDKSALGRQAYRLVLTTQSITVTANTSQGLFYGVQTLVQLVTPRDHQLWLPEGEIVDWPDLQLRVIYWDDAHHLERVEVLKAALRQAAFYKINGFAIKLEGHFQYRSAAAIVEPYALSPAQLQELTAYGLRHYVQVIPYLDGPAHVAFILKHPEFAKLREFPDSNYELCATNPETYTLLFGMYQDLLDANKGSEYFVLSTDEPYFAGTAKNSQCDEVSRAKELGSNGKLLAEFITKTAGYLHDRGRQVLFWGEYPLEPDDIPSLPSYLINGEIYGPKFDPAFKAHGIRQLIFTSTVGWKEFLFPDYYIRPPSQGLPGRSGGAYQPAPQKPGNVGEMFNSISFTPERERADLMGTFVAGWADTGLHPETFWLGYVTGSAAGWRPRSPDPEELMSAFYKLFYGPRATSMGRLYQLMSEQSQFWKESWETAPSNARTPIWGDYPHEVYNPPRPAEDQTLPLLPVPSPELLRRSDDWAAQNVRRLELAAKLLPQNDSLLDLLHENLERVEFNRYNLEVFISIARLCRQNLEMLLDFERINEALKSAETAAGRADPARAVAAIDTALDLSENIWQQRNRALQDAIATWYQSWFPRVAEANGRRYLDKVDDVKDHLPVRTVDMSYLVYRQLLYPLGEWAEQVRAARNQYAQTYHLPPRTDTFDWKDTQTILAVTRAGGEDEE